MRSSTSKIHIIDVNVYVKNIHIYVYYKDASRILLNLHSLALIFDTQSMFRKGRNGRCEPMVDERALPSLAISQRCFMSYGNKIA